MYTTMPSRTTLSQAGTSCRQPSTSTMQMRHAPISLMSFRVAQGGDLIPQGLPPPGWWCLPARYGPPSMVRVYHFVPPPRKCRSRSGRSAGSGASVRAPSSVRPHSMNPKSCLRRRPRAPWCRYGRGVRGCFSRGAGISTPRSISWWKPRYSSMFAAATLPAAMARMTVAGR